MDVYSWVLDDSFFDYGRIIVREARILFKSIPRQKIDSEAKAGYRCDSGRDGLFIIMHV